MHCRCNCKYVIEKVKNLFYLFSFTKHQPFPHKKTDNYIAINRKLSKFLFWVLHSGQIWTRKVQFFYTFFLFAEIFENYLEFLKFPPKSCTFLSKIIHRCPLCSVMCRLLVLPRLTRYKKTLIGWNHNKKWLHFFPIWERSLLTNM